jgi:sugar phosphate isomerase/epimerase
MKGPSIFLAQFIRDEAPFNSLDGLCRWATGHGYIGLQMPTNHDWLFDLEKAATSTSYCDDIRGKLAEHGLEISELSTHLQGQLIAVHPAYDALFDAFAPKQLHGKPNERREWATQQLLYAAKA